MSTTAAEVLVETLARAGVKRVLGVVGDSLNGITDAIRAHDGIEWIGVRHKKSRHSHRAARLG